MDRDSSSGLKVLPYSDHRSFYKFVKFLSFLPLAPVTFLSKHPVSPKRQRQNPHSRLHDGEEAAHVAGIAALT